MPVSSLLVEDRNHILRDFMLQDLASDIHYNLSVLEKMA